MWDVVGLENTWPYIWQENLWFEIICKEWTAFVEGACVAVHVLEIDIALTSVEENNSSTSPCLLSRPGPAQSLQVCIPQRLRTPRSTTTRSMLRVPALIRIFQLHINRPNGPVFVLNRAWIATHSLDASDGSIVLPTSDVYPC